MKSTAPKKIVCSVLISLLQFGSGAYIAEAASREGPRRQQGSSDLRQPDAHRPQNQSNNERLQLERQWQSRREQQERELANWRRQEDQRRVQALRRHDQESEREWHHRQWLEEQRLQRRQEEMRRRQWWEHQRHEEEMQRRSHESEREWHHRQWLEQQRHESELRQIEIVVLSLLLLTK